MEPHIGIVGTGEMGVNGTGEMDGEGQKIGAGHILIQMIYRGLQYG